MVKYLTSVFAVIYDTVPGTAERVCDQHFCAIDCKLYCMDACPLGDFTDECVSSRASGGHGGSLL